MISADTMLSVGTPTDVPKDAICIWKPNPGPQTEFVACPEREVLYGGAAGAGKSDALLMAAARHYKNPKHRAIIFRKTFPELADLIRRSEEIYPAMGGRYTRSKGWRFPSGASVEFGYLDKKKDVYKYKRAWNFMAFDELTHWAADGEDRDKNPVNANYLYLIGSRLRSVAGSELPLEVRATTNPGGPGHEWVRKRFNIPDDGTYSEYFDPTLKNWRIFIPGRIGDCPQLAGTSYETDLDALPEDLRKTLKDGRWDVVAGAAFNEFDHRIHTCEPFPLPEGTRLWRGADDGFNAPAWVGWMAELDGRVFVVQELYGTGMTAEVMGERVMKMDKEIVIQTGDGETGYNREILSGAIDPSAFNEAGLDSTGTGRAQKMNEQGCRWKPAQKGPGSRMAGTSLVHSLLQRRMKDGKPALIFFKTCRNLIRTLPTLPKDENNPDDVDTNGDDHCFDGLKYGLQWRPKSLVFTRPGGV